MATSIYDGREQTEVKHALLAAYLERFAMIVGHWCTAITYVDCFSGPWESRSGEHKDTSFDIALRELRRARGVHAKNGSSELRLRAYFIEKDKAAFAKLESYAATQKDGIELRTRNEELENCISDIVAFVRAGGTNGNFPFLFIDPTGWTGFGLEKIKPLLTLKPGEVLINFMTAHIRRFVEDHDANRTREFEELFGAERAVHVRELLSTVTDPVEREDIMVREYVEAVRTTGGYSFVTAAVVLNPDADTTHFHLIFATRHRKGLEVFKDAERRAMAIMEERRSVIRDEKEQRQTGGQVDMFKEVRKDTHYEMLQRRYGERAREAVRALLMGRKKVPYDELFAVALSFPLIFEADLKEWIADWRKAGTVSIDGLKQNERTPKVDCRHVICWR